MEELAMAENALAKVEELAGQLGQAEGLLERGYAEFAAALLDVQKNRYWQGQHESWGDYMKFVTDKFKLGTRQLYNKLATVKELSGVVELQDITDMGISKAKVLADWHQAGKVTEDDITLAKDPATTVKQLKKAMAEALHQPETETDEWVDLGFAFYANSDEISELREAEKIARGIDPPVSNTLPEHSQKREVAIRWAREFLATYAAPEDDLVEEIRTE